MIAACLVSNILPFAIPAGEKKIWISWKLQAGGKTKENHFPVIMPSFGRKLRKIPLQDLRSFLSAKDKDW